MNQQPHLISAFQNAAWTVCLVTVFALPIQPVRPILQCVRSSDGIGGACLHTEAVA